jgi:hypothetical protein
MSYRNLAFVRFPGRPLDGAGRWAVVPMDSPTIYLHPTADAAHAQIADPRRAKVVDLLAEPVKPVRRLYRNPADQEPD